MVGGSDVPGGWRDRVRRAGRPVWLWPTLLTLAIASAGLGRAQPWRDELATWSAATRPLPDLARMAASVDATLAPYYLLAHGQVALLGDSVTALRVPSVLAMGGAAALTAVLGERLFGVRAGRWGGLLFAVLPSTSRYGQEARPYALATLLAVAATVLLVAATQRPGRGRWVAYAGVVAALGLAHLVALTLLAAHALAVRGTVRRWLLAVVPATAVAIPLVLLARRQQSRQLSWVDPARLGDLAGLPGSLTASAVVGGMLVGLAVVGAARPAGDAPSGADALRALGGAPADTDAPRPAADDGTVGRAMADRRWGWLMLAAVAVPAALLFAAGLVTAVWVPRYLVFTTPFLCLPAGALLASVRLGPALAVVGLTAVLGAPAQLDLRRTHDWPRSAQVDYRAAARIVAAGQRPGDGVVYGSRDGFLFLDLGLAYHLGDERPRDVLAVRDPRRAGDLRAAECARPARCLAGVDRVWLVVAGHRADPVAALPAAKREALDGFATTSRATAPGITVALLTRPG
ncbi:glycosyltransferase family 39 protein [Micromonospora inyonensis]|uniref:Mannosyltransferase n=1 Tax=Micromonospora inyonensis TaxID=47866 RepID=A0A1C6R8S4_9ACTN|nr:glycosyltransferase family 39 protein [Micromonospora inyonensis]SCL13333.1 mannosyltransferase [Micromonospora inyonensis]